MGGATVGVAAGRVGRSVASVGEVSLWAQPLALASPSPQSWVPRWSVTRGSQWAATPSA